MSKQNKRTEISYKVYNTICECDDMGQALEVLTDTIVATIAGNIKGKTDQALIMGACIRRLREYKKTNSKMKPYPVTLKYSSTFELMPGWVPEVLQTWLEEGWTCDITVKRTTQPLTGRRVLVVKITASTSEDLAAKRKALNKMIEAKGYGPNVLRLRPKMK